MDVSELGECRYRRSDMLTFHNDVDVENGLGHETGHRCRADVLDRHGRDFSDHAAQLTRDQDELRGPLP